MPAKSNPDGLNATEPDRVHPMDEKQKSKMALLLELEAAANAQEG